MAEQWRPVVEFEGLFEVSDAGRVRSVSRIISATHQRPRSSIAGTVLSQDYTSTRRLIGRVLKPKTKANGYLEVALRAQGRPQQMAYVHRLVLGAFVGPPSTITHQAAHLSGRRHDNRLSNLAWVAPVVNASHRILHGTHPKRPVTSALKLRAIGVLSDSGMSAAEIAACLSLRPAGVMRSLAERAAS